MAETEGLGTLLMKARQGSLSRRKPGLPRSQMLEKVTPSVLHLQDHQGVVLKINVQFGFNKSEHREWVRAGTAWATPR